MWNIGKLRIFSKKLQLERKKNKDKLKSRLKVVWYSTEEKQGQAISPDQENNITENHSEIQVLNYTVQKDYDLPLAI